MFWFVFSSTFRQLPTSVRASDVHRACKLFLCIFLDLCFLQLILYPRNLHAKDSSTKRLTHHSGDQWAFDKEEVTIYGAVYIFIHRRKMCTLESVNIHELLVKIEEIFPIAKLSMCNLLQSFRYAKKFRWTQQDRLCKFCSQIIFALGDFSLFWIHLVSHAEKPVCRFGMSSSF